MSCKTYSLLLCFLLCFLSMQAQKPFDEGVVVYKARIESADHSVVTGTYTFTYKGGRLRKELKLNNGYEEVILISSVDNTVYSLQNRNNVKYAIQLSMTDLQKRQEKYKDYTLTNETANSKNLAGHAVYKSRINYKNGTGMEVYYLKDWYPSLPVSFDRFPDVRFMPMCYSYTNENGVTMALEASKLAPGPVDNGIFRIPADYKMITNEEYMQMNKQ